MCEHIEHNRIENKGVFKNNGTIYIYETSTLIPFGNGIENQGKKTRFWNQGRIVITNAIGDDGIYNHNNAEFVNHQMIQIAHTGIHSNSPYAVDCESCLFGFQTKKKAAFSVLIPLHMAIARKLGG